MKYRIIYETTASITAYVKVPDEVIAEGDDAVDDYVSEQAHTVVEQHLQTIDGDLGDVRVVIDASIDGDGGGPVTKVEH